MRLGPMALKPLSLLVLWDLAFFIQNVASFCSVTCTTDYETSLNCSCSGSVPVSPIRIEAACSDADVNGSCEIQPPHAWCWMRLEDLDMYASVGITCTARVTQKGNEHNMDASDSVNWMLSDMVKPLQPLNVQVANQGEFFNITWDKNNNYRDRWLIYRVRIRRSKDLLKDPDHRAVPDLIEENNYVVINPTASDLRPLTEYTVDVQVSLNPSSPYKGPWSEWSPTVEWRWGARMEGNDWLWWYLSVAAVILVICVVVCHFQKPFWLRKLQLITYIPRPDDFFKPLYHAYEGNFRDWVKPVFTEYDVRMVNIPFEVMSETQQEVACWKAERERGSQDVRGRTGKQGSNSSDNFLPHGAALLQFQEGSSRPGLGGHSTGHISIHTVTLSGEEGPEEEPSSRCSEISYPDAGSLGLYAVGNRGRGDRDSGEAWRCRVSREGGNGTSSGLSNMDSQPHSHLIEPERISLDSFVSSGQSEDGYPNVDLDTIDSGFGETYCRSPVDFSTEEKIDSTLFHEEGCSNSSYVKQWMACSTLEEDSSSSVHELPENL